MNETSRQQAAESNQIRIHRGRTGLSQRELGQMVGYRQDGSVARHERFMALPPLQIAMSYEIVFRVPVSEIFSDLHQQLEVDLEARLEELEQELGAQTATGRNALATARKLMWLSERRNSDPELVA
jgi:DNA-binding XRE family transcriptional regulator